MEERRWQPVSNVLREFHGFLAPHLPAFRITAANNRRWSEEQYRAQCGTGIFDRRGVYLLFNSSEVLEYVGLATVSFHKRIWSHDDWVDRQWIDVIPFSDETFFLAPALEYLLIIRLRPPKNSVYKNHGISGE